MSGPQSDIATEGWEGLEPGEAPDIREVAQRREDHDRLVARVFGNADGKKLLAWLRDVYVEPPVFTPGAPSDWGFYFEGRRFVVQDLEARLKRATQPEATNGRSTRSTRKPSPTRSDGAPF